MACCKCDDFQSCICENEKKVPIHEQNFLMDQRTQRTLFNNSINLVSVSKKTRQNTTNDLNTQSDQMNATADFDLDEPSTDNRQLKLSREMKSLKAFSAMSSNLDLHTIESNARSHANDPEEASCSTKHYNKVDLCEVSKAADRYGVSDRAAAAIATATLIDFGIITAQDRQFIIDRNKIRRNREKIRAEQMKSLSFDGIQALFFDGRKDSTKVHENNAIKMIKEEHISFVQEPNSFFICHKAIHSGTADSVCDAIESIFDENNISASTIKAIGCDGTSVNTGAEGGVIRKLELKWNRPLQWIICLLHMNELPLRALIKKLDGTTSGPNAFSGPIGKKLKNCEVENIVDFDPIVFDLNTSSLDEISHALNTDQKYLLDSCVAISNLAFSKKLAERAPGAMSHSRWLTTANRILRLYVSENTPSQNLRTLATYIIKVYAPMVFHIKRNWSIVNGPKHITRIIKLSKCLPEEHLKVVEDSIGRNAFLAHPEHITLALLNDNDRETRQNGWLNILSRRNMNLIAPTLRKFKIPQLNFDCENYTNLITMESADPPLLQNIEVSTENIEFLASKPLLDHDFGIHLARIPLHTQAVERCVKVVTEASKSVCGEKKRNGWIANTLGSRNIMPKFETKADFNFSQTFDKNLKI